MADKKKTGIVMTAAGWELYNDAGVQIGIVTNWGDQFIGRHVRHDVEFGPDADIDVIFEAIWEED